MPELRGLRPNRRSCSANSPCTRDMDGADLRLRGSRRARRSPCRCPSRRSACSRTTTPTTAPGHAGRRPDGVPVTVSGSTPSWSRPSSPERCPSPTCTTSPPPPDRTAGRPGPTRSASTCSWSPPGVDCASDGPSRLAWCWFVVALVASLGANVATAGLLDLDRPARLAPHRRRRMARPRLPRRHAPRPLGGGTAPPSPPPEPIEPSLRRATRRRADARCRLATLAPSSRSRSRASAEPRPASRRSRPRWSTTPARSPTTTGPAPATRSTPTPCAPASASRPTSPTPSPPNSPDHKKETPT